MKREERIKQEKGITMLALAIMIIVLLILASVTIAGLTADNGVIKEAQTAKEQAEKAGLEEQIELALVKVESKYRNPTIDNVIEELKNRKIISKDEQVDRETGDIITDLGYKIEGKLEDYIGKVTTGNTTGGNNTSGSGNTTGGNSSSGGNTTGGNTSGGGNTTGGNSTGGGEIAVPDLKDSEVNFTLSKDDWTNQSITVEIACSVTGYTLQYSTNGRDWNNYVNAIGVDENGYVYARLTNNSGKTGGSVRKQITNIDKLLPKQFTPTATSTTNSITLIGSTVDAEQTETNGSSGIDKYYFSKDNGATWEPNNGQTGTSYTFNNLTQNQSYSLKMKATDKAGNEVITETINKTTGTVTDLTSSNVTFTYNPTTPTRGNVTISITTTVTGYTLQYSTNGTTWDNYTTAVTMSNNGEIHARLWDGTNAGGNITGNVNNIDRLAPKQFTPTATSTTNSITLTGSTTDADKTATDNSSGIDKYYFSKDNGATWQPTNGQNGTSYTFNNLTQNQSYSLKMKAIDKAGNEVITDTINKTTGTVTDLTSSNVTFAYNPTTPTRGNVTISITTTVTGYTLQYSTNGTTWDNYTTAVTMSNNGEIHARLWDGTNAGGYATGNVANIDRLPPNQFTPTATSTANSITLTGSTTDIGTGIDKYYFSKDNGATWEPTEGQVGGSYTFSGLTPQTTYNLKMKVIDKAENEVVTNAITKATTQMTMPSTDDTQPYLPTGSTIINDDLDTGVIIKDSNNNEWVWIEVPKSIYTNTSYNEGTAPISSEDYEKIESVMQNYASAYRESGYTDTFYSTALNGFTNRTEYNNWKNSMLKSVYENGGFYIGRYEVGTDSARVSASDTLTKVLIQRDKYPYNFVTSRQAQTLAKQLSIGGKQSSLMFGIQWDLVLKFIEEKGAKAQEELKTDSSSWGNYSNVSFEVKREQGLYTTSPSTLTSWNITSNYIKPSSAVLLTTGASDRNCILGIYDLAGNLEEWTLEYSGGGAYPCVSRGGYYLRKCQ